jgi:hypothetical protein
MPAARHFLALAPGRDYATQPLRPLPEVPDEPDTIQRIRDATTLRDEPEAASDAWVACLADINRRLMSQQIIRDVAEAQKTRPAITPQNRLDTVHQRAKQAHVDMSHPIHLVQRAIDKARLREQPVAPSALDRLEGLEALLDGVAVKRLAA